MQWTFFPRFAALKGRWTQSLGILEKEKYETEEIMNGDELFQYFKLYN